MSGCGRAVGDSRLPRVGMAPFYLVRIWTHLTTKRGTAPNDHTRMLDACKGQEESRSPYTVSLPLTLQEA